MEDNKRTYEFWLDGFPGCYDTLLTLDYDGEQTTREAEYYQEEAGLPYDIGELNPLWGEVVEYDYEGWHKAIMDFYQTKVRELMEEWGLDGSSLSIKGFWSPREYNFRSDELEAEWSPSDEDWNKVLDECRKHRDAFQKYVSERWSSRDGFISFMPDDAREYLDFPLEEWGDLAGNLAGQLLYFVLDEKWNDDYDTMSFGRYSPMAQIEEECYSELPQNEYMDFKGLPEAIKNHSAEILKWLAAGQNHEEAEALYDKILAESRKGDGGDDAPVMSTEFHYGATASNTFEVQKRQ